MKRIELFNDHFQNFKVYGIPHAQLIIADPPYNLGKNAYASSLYAAAMCGRRAYGFEIKKNFFNDANKYMLSQIQQTLF